MWHNLEAIFSAFLKPVLPWETISKENDISVFYEHSLCVFNEIQQILVFQVNIASITTMLKGRGFLWWLSELETYHHVLIILLRLKLWPFSVHFPSFQFLKTPFRQRWSSCKAGLTSGSTLTRYAIMTAFCEAVLYYFFSTHFRSRECSCKAGWTLRSLLPTSVIIYFFHLVDVYDTIFAAQNFRSWECSIHISPFPGKHEIIILFVRTSAVDVFWSFWEGKEANTSAFPLLRMI